MLEKLKADLEKYQQAHKQSYDNTLKLEGVIIYLQQEISRLEKEAQEAIKDVNGKKR